MDPFFRIELRRLSRGGNKRLEGFRHYLHGTLASAAAYRRGEKGDVETDGQRRPFDYCRKRGVAYIETMAPEGAAAFASKSRSLSEEVERVEKRKDALLAYELLLSLPRDVPLERCLPRLRAWIQAECVALGMVADLAVHTYGTPLDPRIQRQAKVIDEIRASGIPIYPLEEGDLLRRMPPNHHHAYELPDGRLLVYQPHAHILLTTREIGPEGFGAKVKTWGQKRQLFRWRKAWAEAWNEMLVDAGRPERVTEVGRRRREAEAKRSGGRIGNAEPTSEETVQTIDIRGGHRAACEGRLPKHQDETAVMTKSAFNEKVRSLAKQEAALQARLEAAESSQDELIEAIARVQDLMDLGLDFDLEDEEGVLISGAAHLLSEHDAQVLTRHRKVLAKVFATPPETPAVAHRALSEAMALIDSLHRDHGVTFFRTQKGSLGYEPEGAVPPEVYRTFAGMHESILSELDRREYARLLVEGRAKLAEQKHQLEVAAQEHQKLQRTLDQERHDRRRLEHSAEVLFESARTGKPLPHADADIPLLQKARHLILGYRATVTAEKARGDEAERTVGALTKKVASLRRGVDHLVRGLGWLVSWVGGKRPELRKELNEEYKKLLDTLPQEVQRGITVRRFPGVTQWQKANTPLQENADQPRAIHTGSAPAAGKGAGTRPEELRTARRAEGPPAVQTPVDKTAGRGAQPVKNQQER